MNALVIGSVFAQSDREKMRHTSNCIVDGSVPLFCRLVICTRVGGVFGSQVGACLPIVGGHLEV